MGLLEHVTAVSALSGAIDGTTKPAPRLAKARADGSPVATQWRCPYCPRYGVSETDNFRHIAIEAEFMRKALPAAARADFSRSAPSLPPIRRIVLQAGRVRWRFVVDVGRRPDGGRDQRTFTFDDYKQAAEARDDIIRRVRAGEEVSPRHVVVESVCPRCSARERHAVSSLASYHRRKGALIR